MTGAYSDRNIACSRKPARRHTLFSLNWVGELLLIGLFAIVVFDPSDSLIGLKKYVFLALMCWWLLLKIGSNKPPPIVPAALAIFFCFGLIFPFLSIVSYYFQVGDFKGYAGFHTLIGFLSLALLVIVSSVEVRALQLFVKVVTVEVFATIGIYIFLSLQRKWLPEVTAFGYDQGFLWINAKQYGNFQFLQIFFKTAPFMVFPLAYYSARYFGIGGKKNDILALWLMVASCVALLISGTRADIAFALIIPTYFAICSLQRDHLYKKIFIALVLGLLFSMVMANLDILLAMLDPSEKSNAIKLGYWNDYMEIFLDPVVFLFGQGIGAVHYFQSLGEELRITEVTLLELIRNFGVVVAAAYVLFWVAPVFLLGQRKFSNYRWLRVGYIAYLCISMSNYFILSSTGMVLLSVVYGICLERPVYPNISLRQNTPAKSDLGTLKGPN